MIAVENFRTKFLFQTRMARKAADNAVGQAKRELISYGRRAGRTVVIVPPAYTTMTCSRCAARAKQRLERSERVFVCEFCGYTDGRDRNAARVILAQVGFHLDRLACGVAQLVQDRRTGLVQVGDHDIHVCQPQDSHGVPFVVDAGGASALHPVQWAKSGASQVIGQNVRRFRPAWKYAVPICGTVLLTSGHPGEQRPMSAPDPKAMRDAMADYVRATMQAYIDAAAHLPPADRARLPILRASRVTVIAAGTRYLHVLGTTETLPAPVGQEVLITDSIDGLTWNLRFFDPVVAPGLGLIDESESPQAGQVREGHCQLVRRVLGLNRLGTCGSADRGPVSGRG